MNQSAQPVFPEGEKKRALNLIMLAIVCTSLGQAIVFTILPLLAREVGLKELQVGFIFFSSSIAFTLSSAWWGRRSDTLGRKPVMLIGLAGYACGTVVFTFVFWLGLGGVLAGTMLFVALVLARILQASVMSGTPPAATAYIADITLEAERTGGMARVGAAHNIGTIMGPAIGAALALTGLLSPLLGAIVIVLGGMLVIYLFLPHAPVQEVTQGRARLKILDGRYAPFLFMGVAMYMCFSVIHMTLGFYYADRLGVSSARAVQLLGISMTMLALFSLAGQVILVQKARLRPIVLIRIGLPLFLAGVAMLAFAARLEFMILGMVLIGLGMGVTAPGYNSAASLRVRKDEQGGLAGLTSAAPAMGYILGPVIGTGLYQYNITWPYYFDLVVLVPLVLYSMLISTENTHGDEWEMPADEQ